MKEQRYKKNLSLPRFFFLKAQRDPYPRQLLMENLEQYKAQWFTARTEIWIFLSLKIVLSLSHAEHEVLRKQKWDVLMIFDCS